jgi:hypothetical protein
MLMVVVLWVVVVGGERNIVTYVVLTLVKWQKQSGTQNCLSRYRGIICPLQQYQV